MRDDLDYIDNKSLVIKEVFSAVDNRRNKKSFISTELFIVQRHK